jgi:ribosomal protein S12 methylthiotransferase accessory factor
MGIEIEFPGGVAVDAQIKGFTVHTDQPKANGGANAAPSPFDLFLASLGTCAGFFALRFCQQRDLDTAGLRFTLDTERDPEAHRVSRVRIAIHLPEGFPEKYRKAIVRATDQCSVKRHILEPPAFEVTAV